jgi:hypothetical protein
MTQPRTALIPVPTDDRATRIAACIGQIEGLLTTLRAELNRPETPGGGVGYATSGMGVTVVACR